MRHSKVELCYLFPAHPHIGFTHHRFQIPRKEKETSERLFSLSTMSSLSKPPPPPPAISIPSPALAPESPILITGANGLLASHLCSALLSAGHRVRGTVRNARKHAWLADLFATRHGPDRFERFEVPDMAAPGAFADAVRGCAGVVHVAAPMLTETDVGKIVEGAVGGVREVLRAVEGEAGVKRVVVTSSAVAVRGMGEFVVGGGGGKEGVKVRVDEWNEDAVRAVEESGGLEGMGVEERVMVAYAAGKTLAEKAVWEWEERVGRGRGVVVNTGMYWCGCLGVFVLIYAGSGAVGRVWEAAEPRTSGLSVVFAVGAEGV